MAKFTLLEVHLDGASVDANADAVTALPFSSVITGEEDDETIEDDTTEDPSSADESGGSILGPIVFLLVLVGLAIAIKKVLGGDSTAD